jgi:flagellar assembly protein FliH
MSSDRPVQPETSASEPFLYLSPDIANGDAQPNGDPLAWSPAGYSSKAVLEQREKASFDRGAAEGEARAGAAFEKQLAVASSGISAGLEQFRSEREAYFARIEPEIVQLALAIARKILHREAQMDPLLLAGMVHVALEKVETATRVRLRANPADIHYWNEHFSQGGTSQAGPELIGDATLQHGECALETEIGSTQISLETQLKEIEQGFFDLLEQRPKVR